MMTRTILTATLLLFSVPAYALECAFIQDGVIVKRQTFKPGSRYKTCPESQKGYTILPFVREPKPAFDAATQVLTGPTVTIGETAVTETYTVRDKTAEELASEVEAQKEDKLQGMGELVLRRLCDHESRLRVLEGKSAVTFDQCRAAIKAAIQ